MIDKSIDAYFERYFLGPLDNKIIYSIQCKKRGTEIKGLACYSEIKHVGVIKFSYVPNKVRHGRISWEHSGNWQMM